MRGLNKIGSMLPGMMKVTRLFSVIQNPNLMLSRSQLRRCFSEAGETAEASNFDQFKLSSKTKSVLNSKGIKTLFPVQEATFAPIYEGKDIVAKDRTGSGKTIAYTLPVLERIRAKEENPFLAKDRGAQMIVLVPTRELANQVAREITSLKHSESEFNVLAVYGGTSIDKAISELKRGVDVLVATPGRLTDMMERGMVKLSSIKTVVLDETDEMLNIGFKDSIDAIIQNIIQAVPLKPQFLLFSATIPPWVQNATRSFMSSDKLFIDMVKESTLKTPAGVKHLALKVGSNRNSVSMISDLISYYSGGNGRTIVFTETKHVANKIMLDAGIKTECQVLHGDIPQSQREITFQGFREGSFKCLIATNVAARGLDIPHVELIIQVGLPQDLESYIHRAGRTARAGRNGTCLTIYTREDEYKLDEYSKQAGFTFEKIGAPQPEQIVKAAGRDAINLLETVNPEILPIFTESVAEILEAYGAEEAMKRALALITGHTKKLSQRSLLTSEVGYVTACLFLKKPITTVTEASNYLRFLGLTHQGAPRLSEDRSEVYFDLPEKDKPILEALDSVEFEYPHQIPASVMGQDRGSVYSSGSYSGRSRDDGNSYSGNKVYVIWNGENGGQDLEECLVQNGHRPQRVDVLNTGGDKSFAFVRMASNQEAKNLISLSKLRHEGTHYKFYPARNK
jgi:ATP-dependent RNA helicase DDX21